MANFKDPSKMDPSEMVAYIGALHSEITGQAEELRRIKAGDTFAQISTDGKLVRAVFDTEQELLDKLTIGDVVQVQKFKKLDQAFAVKINDYRIDSFADRIKAEGVAMLHRVD